MGLAAFLGLTPSAMAASAWMQGTAYATPGYASITGPNGERCATGTTACKQIATGFVGTKTGEANLTKWVAANGNTGNTVWAYSASTNSVIDHLNAHPEDGNTYLLFGSPSKPTAPNNAGASNSLVLTNTNAKVYFVSVYGDSVAMPNVPEASFSKHTNGYRNLDARTPTTTAQPAPNVTDNVYGAPAPTAPKVTLASVFKKWQAAAAERKAAREERREARKLERQERAEARAAEREAKKAEKEDVATQEDSPAEAAESVESEPDTAE